MTDKEQFITLSEKLLTGLVREAIGYRIERPIPYYKGIFGYMVEAPMLWIRHSRFPILVVAYDQRGPEILDDLAKQMEIAQATEYFALLIVVPLRPGSVDAADELRKLVSNSVYGQDFVVLGRRHIASIIAQNNAQRLVQVILEQGFELSTLSPYVLRGPVPETMFFGREREIKEIARDVRTRDHAIVGTRRIGKSSMLLKLKRLFNSEPRYRAVYINCEDKFSGGDLLKALSLRGWDGSASAALRTLISGWSLGDPDRLPILLLDEVDELLERDTMPSSPLFKTFRALSHEGLCRFVFSGSRVLYDHLRNPSSPFFNFCEHLVLKRLDDKSIREIFTKPMRQFGIELCDEEALVRCVVELSSGHPNIAQWICDRLLRKTKARRITLSDLEELNDDSEYREHYVRTAWGEANAMEKLISLVVGPEGLNYGDLLARLVPFHVLDDEKVYRALDMLEFSGLLKREGEHYGFGMAHFPVLISQLGRAEPLSADIRALLQEGQERSG